MQTFLPYPDFKQSLSCLDTKRLGKQRVEAYQILNAINLKRLGFTKVGWGNHPAVRMWEGFTPALTVYYNLSLQAFSRRRRKDGRFCQNVKLCPIPVDGALSLPPWFGGGIHRSHRAVLLFKDFEFYSQYGWEEQPKSKCFWPV